MTDSVPERALTDRVAIVTCGGHAVGRAYSRALAAAGAHVVIADPSEEAGEEAVALIENTAGSARFVSLDVTSPASASAAVDFAVAAFGHVDVLVNNPSRYGDTRFTSLADFTVEQWDRTMAVMVRGVMLMCQAAVPALAASTHPTIVNHTSSAAYGVRNWLDYGTARGAVIAMTRSLAKELAPQGIRVNALCVGSLASEAIALGVIENEEQMTGTPDFEMQLIQRVATEDDVAGPIVFLASDASRYMTGQTVSFDGGKYLLG